MKDLYKLLGFVVALVGLAVLSPASASAIELESGKLYGFVPKSSSALQMQTNKFYSFDLNNPSAGKLFGTMSYSSYYPDAAGTFLDNGDFIGVGGSYTKTFIRFTADSNGSWSISNYRTISNIVTDFANDKGTVYAWYQPSLGSWSLGQVDVDELTISPIGNTTGTKLIALAAGDGKIWGIGTDGNLYSVSKTDGALTMVGSTGKTVADTPQSACYDFSSGTILWARYDNSSMWSTASEIVTVNATTGAATTKGSLANSPQVIGLFTPISISADAPSEVTELAATNDGTTDDITVTFTMPVVNNGGKELNPNLKGLSYTISVDGETAIAAKASTVGAEVSETFTSTPGTHTVTVFASQALYGNGPEVKTSVFVGPDTPGAPVNPQAVSDGTEVTVTWQAPEGKNGGHIDASKLAYKVVRMPDGVTVADNLTETSFTETIDADKLQGFTYLITTIYDNVEGETAETPRIFAGPSFEVTRENAYIQDFQNCATADDAGFFVTGKAQYDGTADPYLSLPTQEDNNYLQVKVDTRATNPKLFTTALKLKARHSYRLSFKFRSGSNYGASFAVYLTDKPTEDCKNVMTLMETKSYGYPDSEWQNFTEDRVTPAEFQVEETGVYFVSVQHGFMAANWEFDDFKVEDITEPGIPNTPADMQAEAAEGTRTVTVSFTLPAKDNNDDDPQMTSVELKRGEEVVYTRTEDLVPGAKMSWTDEKAPLGINTYSVTVSNANGTSAAASASVKVGRDYDLGITVAEAPESVVKGRPFTLSATVHNNGINRAPMGEQEYSLSLVRALPDGQTVIVKSWDGITIEPDEEMTYSHTLDVPADAGEKLNYYFYLTYEMDENQDDNRSTDVEIAVITPEFPTVTNLSATWNDGKIDLAWTAPTYNAEVVTLTGYDVYINGEKFNGETPVAETTYSATVEDGADYICHVVAVYDLGHSAASDEVNILRSGIGGTAAGQTFAVSVNNGALHVNGATGDVTVYDASGRTVASAKAYGRKVSFTLDRGTYIVTAGGKSVKVAL